MIRTHAQPTHRRAAILVVFEVRIAEAPLNMPVDAVLSVCVRACMMRERVRAYGPDRETSMIDCNQGARQPATAIYGVEINMKPPQEARTPSARQANKRASDALKHMDPPPSALFPSLPGVLSPAACEYIAPPPSNTSLFCCRSFSLSPFPRVGPRAWDMSPRTPIPYVVEGGVAHAAVHPIGHDLDHHVALARGSLQDGHLRG